MVMILILHKSIIAFLVTKEYFCGFNIITPNLNVYYQSTKEYFCGLILLLLIHQILSKNLIWKWVKLANPYGADRIGNFLLS